jgi:hypothetical protein
MVTDSIIVDVLPLPNVRAGSATRLCFGDSVLLGVDPAPSGATSFSWKDANGTIIGSANRQWVHPAVTTTYYLTVIDTNGCVGVDSVTVSVNERPTVAPFTEYRLCAETGIRISAPVTGGSQPLRYEWTPATGLSSWSVADPFAQPDSTTTYTVVVTDASGCSDTGQVRVSVRQSDLVIVGGAGTHLYDFGRIGAGASRCDSVRLMNRGTDTIALESSVLRLNTAFSVPPSQFPIILPPGESRWITVCFAPGSAIAFSDTMLLAFDCASPLTLAGNGVVETFGVTDNCGQRLRIIPDSLGLLSIVARPRPNPAASHIVVSVVRAAAAEATETCALVDVNGVTIATATPHVVSVRTVGIQALSETEYIMDVSSVPAGAYFVRYRSGAFVRTTPVIVAH